ncbi:MAG: hypothetical protein HYY51_01245 [Candidatus Magasanikbacteria bacterium]|nr:hypothetical protein [Candidatus Magasanikbacteria bacterium]
MDSRSAVNMFMAAVSGLIAGLALFMIYLVQTRLSFTLVLLLWFLFLFWSARFFSFEKKNIVLHYSTAVAFVSLQSLVEWKSLHIFLSVLNAAVFVFLWYWSARAQESETGVQFKTWRRVLMILWVFNVYSWSTALFALHIFFENLPFALLAGIGACFGTLGAGMIWNLYFKGHMRTFGPWFFVVALIVAELMWVMRQLPFGYLAMGFLLSWIWYLVQLFIRFHLSEQGILWKKQRLFLALNTVLYGVVLYVARWI